MAACVAHLQEFQRMSTLSPESLVERLSWRYAVKKFDAARRIPDATFAALEQSLILSPSSYGLQPWRFVVITDPAVKAKLPPISWNQSQPRDCSHMVVIAGRKTITPADVEAYTQRIAQVRGVKPEVLADYKAMMMGTVTKTPADKLDDWCARQCYIALGFLMSAAAVLGVDACPMEGIVHAEYDKLLGLPEKGYASVVGCALGYRAGDDWLASMKKVRDEAGKLVIRV
jgi:nitroreductase